MEEQALLDISFIKEMKVRPLFTGLSLLGGNI